MNIGSRIKTLRLDYGLSQEELGEKLHVTRQTVSNWENDKNYPDLSTLVQIAELFDVTIDEMIKDDADFVQENDAYKIYAVKSRRWIRGLLFSIVLICLLIFAYVTAKTELEIWETWDTSQSTYELEDGEVLYTSTHFDKNGLAPIRIKNIQFLETMTMTEIGADGYLCYVDRITQGWYPPGMGIEGKSFFDEFGENMIPKDDAKWINEDFEVIELKKGNKLTKTYCRVTYAIWGIFEKQITGTSKEM